MIYLDNAATTLVKPPSVGRAMVQALHRCASPGRGGHPPAMAAAELAYRCRERLGTLLGVSDPERVIFTSSATHGLNIAIRSIVQPGDRVVISGYEHNAVTRTLASIPNVEFQTAAGQLFDPEGDLEAFLALIDQNPAAVICTHVSNVFGYVLPVAELADLCRARGVPLIVDASQSAGLLDVDADRWGAAFVALPGHKGLYGPQGTGVLLCGRESKPVSLLTGGTGSESRLQSMPELLPDALEPGTHNMPGIAGIYAGAGWVMERGTARILAHERNLMRMAVRRLSALPGVELFMPSREEERTGVLSIRLSGLDCEEGAQALSERGICLRAGLHCAPLAHAQAGTLDTGTLRVSFSAFTTPVQVDAFARVLAGLVQK